MKRYLQYTAKLKKYTANYYVQYDLIWVKVCFFYFIYYIEIHIYNIYGGGGLVAKLCPTYDLMDCSPPGSSVMGFPGQEYWSGFPFPSQEIIPIQGLNLPLLNYRWIIYF